MKKKTKIIAFIIAMLMIILVAVPVMSNKIEYADRVTDYLLEEQNEDNNLLTTYSTSSQVLESPEYINENIYSGNELDIIRLINQRMKYTFEENESEYMKLFHATSPINGLPKYKLKTVKLLDGINIQEQKYSFVALVKAEDIVISGEAFNYNYVFIKAKNSKDEWKIGDID